VNCQKACKKCDDTRPCERCVKYGLETSCQDSARKERKKGVKRGPYHSRIVEDGDSDESDSTRWSDEVRMEGSGRGSPVILRFRYDEKSPTGDAKNWSFSTHQQGTNSTRNSRNRAGTEQEHACLILPATRPSLQVGVPDSTYIKALGVVCTEILRKIEEEDLPPAVSFSVFPPREDMHFQPVSFTADSMHEVKTLFADEPEVLIRQPLPVQRIVNAAVLENELYHPVSSSPLGTEINDLARVSCDIMTPPETPANVPPELAKKHQEGQRILSLPSIKDFICPIRP